MHTNAIRLLALCTLGAAALPASAGGPALFATHHSIVWDDDARTVTFSITYNRLPDFFTLDSMGRQADSFQWYLDTLPGDNGFGGAIPWETIIRGEEIHIAGDIRIRDATRGPGGGPDGGGWGPLVGSVPYTMVDTTQTFIVPFATLNTPDGNMAFELQLLQYGRWTGDLYSGRSIPALAAGAVMLGVIGVGATRRRR
jgi:hypothetical protein